jgi:hypothetical protein
MVLTAEIYGNCTEQVLLNNKIPHALNVIFHTKTREFQNQRHLISFEVVV